MRALRMFFAAATFSASVAWAGTADVKFVDPDHFTDLGTDKRDEPQTMQSLAAHLQRLAARLPADQVLHVDVLDVDLPGRVTETRRGPIRVTRSALADPPRMRLRYRLEANGQVLREGEERLTEVDYREHVSATRSLSALDIEKRLVADWFARTFGGAPSVP